LTKCSRFIRHPLKQVKARSLRVAATVVVTIVILFAVIFLFFLVWLLSKEDIGSHRPITSVWVGRL